MRLNNVGSLSLQPGSSSTGDVIISTFSYGTGSGTQLRLECARGTQASPTITQNADQMGQVGFWGYDSAFVNTAAIVGIANQAWSAGTARGTNLQFYVTPASTITNIVMATLSGTGLAISRTFSGGSVGLSIQNPSNTAGAQAILQLGVGGTSATGDPFIQFGVTGAQNTAFGVDVSDGSTVKLSLGNTLGSSDAIVVTQGGQVTFPLTCSFLALANSTQNDVTGDGTAYIVQFNTEILDKGSNFASNQLTAPRTGAYPLTIQVTYSGALVGHTAGALTISTSNRNYPYEFQPFTILSATGNGTVAMSVNADMDAGDVAGILFSVVGATKVIDISSTGAATFYSGNLEN